MRLPVADSLAGSRSRTNAAPTRRSANSLTLSGRGRSKLVPAASGDGGSGGTSASAANTGRSKQLLALGGCLAALAVPTYSLLSSADLPPLPPPPPLPELLGGGAAAAGAAAATLAGPLRGRVHPELHRGRLYVQLGPAPDLPGPLLPPGAVVVRPTGDVRGNGAFAAAPIPAGAHLGDYTGDLLDRRAFFRRYPDGVGDYAMAIDDEWVVDGAGRAPDTSSFHPVHMNHSRLRANVRRWYWRAQGRVSFFAARDVQPGEELLFDYGRAYWRGREHLELP